MPRGELSQNSVVLARSGCPIYTLLLRRFLPESEPRFLAQGHLAVCLPKPEVGKAEQVREIAPGTLSSYGPLQATPDTASEAGGSAADVLTVFAQVVSEFQPFESSPHRASCI